MKIPDVGGRVLWTSLYLYILLLFWFLMIFARTVFIKIIFIRIFFVETGVLTFFFLCNGHTIMTRTYVFSRLIVFTLFSDFFFLFLQDTHNLFVLITMKHGVALVKYTCSPSIAEFIYFVRTGTDRILFIVGRLIVK